MIRLVLCCLLFGCFALPWSAAAEDNAAVLKPIRIGLTPVVMRNQQGMNEMFGNYLAKQIGRPVEMVQRQTYRDIIKMLERHELDAAWICGLPYIRNADWIKLLAVPENGFNASKPSYRSLTIVSKTSEAKTMDDLRGGIFAFADIDSNSGHLVPSYQLLRRGTDEQSFFSLTFFTHAHHNVVRAVAKGMADAGSVDSYVFHVLQLEEPTLTDKVKVIAASEEFAFPPVVAGKNMDALLFQRLQHIFLNMDDNAEGRRVLQHLHLSGFRAGQKDWYKPIADMDAALHGQKTDHDMAVSVLP